MSVITIWNEYINYLKETVAKGLKPLGFEQWRNADKEGT